jgi:hypothetical protein
MCDRVMVICMERIIACRTSRKGHIPDIVFHCSFLISPEEKLYIYHEFKKHLIPNDMFMFF